MPTIKLSPSYDNKIYQKYSKNTIQNKEKNKIAFCKNVDLAYHKKVPLICVTYPLTDKNNVHMIQDIMNGLLEQPIQLVVMGTGSLKYQTFFTDLSSRHHSQIVIAENGEDNKRKIYAAADMILLASDSPECMEEVHNAMAYGTIPVMPPADFVVDYDPVQEKGNAFFYNPDSPWGFFAALIRALENFHFPYDWKNIQIEAMND